MTGLLPHSPADVVASLLTGVLGYENVFVGDEPNSPDECVTVYDTAGTQNGRSMIDGGRWEYYGIQVRVRSPRQDDAARLAWAVATSLDSDVYDAPVTVTDVTGTASTAYLVHALQRTSGPISLGKEAPASGRTVFTLNLLAGIKSVG